jgi:hypothetical protein
MDRLTALNEKQWQAEAIAAVVDDGRWTCLTAAISDDGCQLLALYRRPLTGTRRYVRLARDHFQSLSERATEIRRCLGIALATRCDVPRAK